MKKLLTIVLAMIMVLSMTAVSFAGTEYTDQSTVKLEMQYKAPNGGNSAAETFNFGTVTCTSVKDAGVGVTTENAPLPTIKAVTYTSGEAGSETATKNVEIELPTYTAIGIYTYTFKQNAGNSAGVTYWSKTMTLTVNVMQGTDGLIRVAYLNTDASEKEKTDEVINEYYAGSLTVGKIVTGLMGDKSKVFNVTVSFEAPNNRAVTEEITYVDREGNKQTIKATDWENGEVVVGIALSDGETVTFNNIPYNVTYDIEEYDYTGEGYDQAKYTGSQKSAMNAASKTVTITNNKKGSVATGIILDNGLYLVILAGVAIVAGIFFMRRRRQQEDDM